MVAKYDIFKKTDNSVVWVEAVRRYRRSKEAVDQPPRRTVRDRYVVWDFRLSNTLSTC